MKALLPFFIFFMVIAGLSIRYPPVVAIDQMEGLLVWKNFENGGKFNYTQTVDQNDISRNREEFVAWWTPGQYVFPGIIKSVFGFNWGISLVLSAFFAVCIFLAGYRLLLKRLGFDDFTIYASMVIVALQVHVFHPFILFPGGDIFYNAFIPWSLLLLVAMKPAKWYYYPVFFLVGLLGFFIKSSFLTLFAAFPFVSLALLYIKKERENSGTALFKHLALWGITVGAACGVAYYLFISKGDNPAVLTDKHGFFWINFLFPLASPITSAFSIDLLIDIYYKAPMHIDFLGIKVSPMLWSFYWIMAIGSLLLAAVILISRMVSADYKILFGIIFIVMASVYSFFYMNDAQGVGMDGRHYYALGLLFIPGIIKLTVSKNWLLATLLFGIIGVQIFSGFYLMGNYKLNAIRAGVKGKSGITLAGISRDALNKIYEIDDDSDSNTIIHLPNYEWMMEVKNARASTEMEIWLDAGQINGYATYRGCAAELYVLGTRTMADDGRLQAILGNYKDYGNFEKIWEDENSVIMKGSCKTVATE